MPTTLTLTEEAALRLAPDVDAIKAARDLLRKKSFIQPAVSADGTWLLAQCKGSGKDPYQVSIDLQDQTNPTFRCSCPSRKFPCKHGVGLLLLYSLEGDKFATREPSEDLQAKREKKAAREKKKEEDADATAAPAAPRKVNKAAQTKKVAAQRDGLDLLEKLVVDLAAGGQWYAGSRLDKLEEQALQLGDAYLPAAMYVVNQLVQVGRQDDLSEEERTACASELIGRMWATVQKGRNYLDDKLAGDENQAEADAVLEEVLGRSWQLTELKEKGYFKTGLTLLELAWERTDDQARKQRVEVSHLLELNDGLWYQAIAYRPFKGMQHIAEQPSYLNPMQVSEAAVYPGFINRRVRWDKGADKGEQVSPDHLQKAYERARPDFKAALDAFRQQMKHPLAPREACMLLRCRRIGMVGPRVVLEDAAGVRIEAVDRRKDYSSLANLVRAAGWLGDKQPAVGVRLHLIPLTGTLAVEPLALLTPEQHLRLGL